MTNEPFRKPGRGFHIPEPVKDTLLFVGQWLIVTVGLFAWWMAIQLVISLFLVNVWHVTFRQILTRTVALTAVSSIVYLLVMLRRDEKKRGR